MRSVKLYSGARPSPGVAYRGDMMEKKIVAAIAVITMVFAAVVPLVAASMSDGAEASQINVTLGDRFVLYVNEANYNHGSYSADFYWVAKNESISEVQFTNNEIQLEKHKISIVNNVDGRYVFEISGEGALKLSLSWYAVLTIKEGETEVSTKTLDAVTFNLDVKPSDSSSEIFEIESISGQSKNVWKIEVKAKIGKDPVTNDDWNWYAIGLPEGLTMAPNGMITGVPTGECGQKKVTVTITNGKTSHTRTLTIIVQENTSSNITWSIDNGTEIKSPSAYIATTGESDVNLITYVGRIQRELDSVLVIDGEGNYSALLYSDRGYVLPTEGVGSYVVVMKYHNSDTKTMNLHVVPPSTMISTGIVVSHDP